MPAHTYFILAMTTSGITSIGDAYLTNSVMILQLKTAACSNQPFETRSPLDDCALDLCPSLSFHARSVRCSFSTRISSRFLFAASENFKSQVTQSVPLIICWIGFTGFRLRLLSHSRWTLTYLVQEINIWTTNTGLPTRNWRRTNNSALHD